MSMFSSPSLFYLGYFALWCTNTLLPKDNELSCNNSFLLCFLIGGANTIFDTGFSKHLSPWSEFLLFPILNFTLLITASEYLHHPCHGQQIANTFILKYQNNIISTETQFSTLSFWTCLKWLKMLLFPTWREPLPDVLHTSPSVPTV